MEKQNLFRDLPRTVSKRWVRVDKVFLLNFSFLCEKFSKLKIFQRYIKTGFDKLQVGHQVGNSRCNFIIWDTSGGYCWKNKMSGAVH